MTTEDLLKRHLTKKERSQLTDNIKDSEDLSSIRSLGLGLLKVYNDKTSKIAITTSTAKKGNVVHHHRFKEIYTRMEIAEHSGFYMEASALLENLFTDRLISLLDRYLDQCIVDHNGYALNFKKLLDKAKEVYGYHHPVLKSVDKWRKTRNRIIHGFMEDGKLVEDFFQDAKKQSIKGRKLMDEFMTFFRVQKAIQKKYQKHQLSTYSRSKIARICSSLSSQKLDNKIKSEISDVILKEKRKTLRD